MSVLLCRRKVLFAFSKQNLTKEKIEVIIIITSFLARRDAYEKRRNIKKSSTRRR